jgi:membrane protein
MALDVKALAERVQKLRAVRVFTRYGTQRGPILAAGLAYQALFATFAALWVAFSIAGLTIQSNPEFQSALFELLQTNLPGLIKGEDGTGVIDPATLLETGILNITGLISLLGLFATALGWLASGRDAVRSMFLIGPVKTNFLLLKLKDVALAFAFGAALLVSTALSIGSTAALSTVLDWLGKDGTSGFAHLVARLIGLFLVFLLDTVVLALFYRFVSGIPIPPRRLLGGSLIGAAALGVLKALGSSLLGGATSNPLLAGFAVIIGLLIWFNFICQVILIAAAWIAVGMADRGIVADPELEARRIVEERLEEERIRNEVLAEIAADDGEKRKVWWRRLLRR